MMDGFVFGNRREGMGKLSTHVLDVTQGKPGVGVALELYRLDGGSRRLLKQAVTNSDGRCDAPLLQGEEMQAGMYELVFAAGDYFAGQGMALPQPRFIDRVSIAFGIADAGQNYHVPLVVSPWAYSTYRGS
jgi:5-hydroxyisourate hydrolase